MGYLSCRADSSVSVSNADNKPIKIHEYDYSVLEAATSGFSDRKLLGRGSHGLVYKAVLRGRPVAVKRPSARSDPSADNEIQILSRLHSPALVNLVGVSSDHPPRRLMVVEFMSNGTLHDVLHSPSSKPPNWPRRLRLALQTATAVHTLHSSSPPVIHRDIKSANVLIDRNFNARLGDFGLALQCHVDDFRLRSTPPAGTMGYIDPCYVTPDNLSTKTDVFSFGILLLEIISGRKAIDLGHSPPSVVDWAIPLVKKGKLLAIYDPRVAPPGDPVVRKQLAVIAAKCVRSCRERRPAMGDVVNWLAGMCKLVPLHSWSGFNNPCLMAENVGRPVEARIAHFNSRREGGDLDATDGGFGVQAMRNARRVYSDLGMRNNLMDLMAGNDGEEVEGEPRPRSRVLSARFGSGRCVRRGGGGEGERRSSLAPANDIGLVSRGNGSGLHSRRFNLGCRAADDV